MSHRLGTPFLSIYATALGDAFEKCRRVHRDVTPGNIILFRHEGSEFDAARTGYLIDWDLSRAAIEGQTDFREVIEVSAGVNITYHTVMY